MQEEDYKAYFDKIDAELLKASTHKDIIDQSVSRLDFCWVMHL